MFLGVTGMYDDNAVDKVLGHIDNVWCFFPIPIGS
jgi:hypothetical protein